MWIAPSGRDELQEALFHFLLTVRDGHPRAVRPLVAERKTLVALYNAPYPDLVEAARHCLDALLIDLGSDPAAWGEIAVPGQVFGFVLAFHNVLASSGTTTASDGGEPDVAGDFTTALVAALPPARDRDALLATHAVLRGIEGMSLPLGGWPHTLLHALIERSPLTALWALDAHMPAALDGLTADLLPGWTAGEPTPDGVWAGVDDWLTPVSELLGDPRIARWLRHRWLAMPETRPACRNLGLLLEALSRREGWRDLILEFYEAYAYFRVQVMPDDWEGIRLRWPIFEVIAPLLLASAGGDESPVAEALNEAALLANRRGNEYLLKFWPLIQIVIEEGGIPTDYPHLIYYDRPRRRNRYDLFLALQALSRYATIGSRGAQRISFGQVVFEDDEQGADREV